MSGEEHEGFAEFTDSGYHGACHECGWVGPLYPRCPGGKAAAMRDGLSHERVRVARAESVDAMVAWLKSLGIL